MTWKEINDRRKKHIRYGEGLFLRMYREISQQLKASTQRVQTPEQLTAIIDQFNPDIDIRDYYKKFYTRTGMDFAKLNYRQIKSLSGKAEKKDLNTDIRESIWLEKILKFVDEKCGFKINQVYWSHVQDIIDITRKAVTKGVSEGWGIEKIVDNLFSEISEREKWKAMRIARTEVVSASNMAAMQGAADTGIETEKIWLHPMTVGPSGFLRDDHLEMNEARANIDEPFNMPDGYQMQYPGDPEAPAHHVINCRCTVAFEPKGGGLTAQLLGEI